MAGEGQGVHGMTREHFETDQKKFRDAAVEPVHTIGWAVAQMKDGKKVHRAGWNGKGMYVAFHQPHLGNLITLPFVYMFTAKGETVPWLCSQTDLLAEDWVEYTNGG
jgi:hypothetical protein